MNSLRKNLFNGDKTAFYVMGYPRFGQLAKGGQFDQDDSMTSRTSFDQINTATGSLEGTHLNLKHEWVFHLRCH